MKDYKFLKTARTIFKWLAWFVLGLGVIVGLIVVITGGRATGAVTPAGVPVPTTPKAAGLVFMVMGALYYLILQTISEVIGLLLDIKGVDKPASVA